MSQANAVSLHRDAVETRRLLLVAAAREIHRFGFRAASVTRILADTGMTKGALYHHFPSKLALGHAVVDECYAPQLRRTWIEPLEPPDADPVAVLTGILQAVGGRMTREDIRLGCPVNNLAQEMSPVDQGFRVRIEALFDAWRSAIAAAFARSVAKGLLRPGVDPHAVASFVVGSIEGCVGMAKNAQSRKVLHDCGAGLIDYLQSLRAPAHPARKKHA